MSVMGIFTNNALGCQLSLSGELPLALLVRGPATKTDRDTARETRAGQAISSN